MNIITPSLQDTNLHI